MPLFQVTVPKVSTGRRVKRKLPVEITVTFEAGRVSALTLQLSPDALGVELSASLIDDLPIADAIREAKIEATAIASKSRRPWPTKGDARRVLAEAAAGDPVAGIAPDAETLLFATPWAPLPGGSAGDGRPVNPFSGVNQFNERWRASEAAAALRGHPIDPGGRSGRLGKPFEHYVHLAALYAIAVLEDPDRPNKVVADLLGVDRRTVANELMTAAKQGLLTKPGRGVNRELTARGRAEVADLLERVLSLES